VRHCQHFSSCRVGKDVSPAGPTSNGKVERSHLTDQLEFYQLLDYTGDVDLRAKLAVWEEFYNLQRPHAALAVRYHEVVDLSLPSGVSPSRPPWGR